MGSEIRTREKKREDRRLRQEAASASGLITQGDSMKNEEEKSTPKGVANALAAAIAEMESPSTDRSNPAFPKHRYATLGQFLDTARPILARHGLALNSDTELLADGNLVCFTVIRSVSGESLRIAPVPVRVNMLKPQETGSGLTYARRYSISMALGIVADDDDDGNLASGVGNGSRDDHRPKASSPPAKESTPPTQGIATVGPKARKEEIVFAEPSGAETVSMALAEVKVINGTTSTGRDWVRFDLLGRELLPDGSTDPLKVSTFDSKLGAKAEGLIGKTIDIVIRPGKGTGLDLVSIKGVNDELPF